MRSPPEEIERDQTILRLVGEEGWTYRRVAETIGLSRSLVGHIVRRAGIQAAPRPEEVEKAERNQTIIRLIADEGWTFRRAADAFEISTQRVNQLVKRAKVMVVRGAQVDVALLHADYQAYLHDHLPLHEVLARHQLTRGRFARIRRAQGWPIKQAFLAARATKRCPACGIEKSATTEHFVAKKDGRGLRSYCKSCQAAKARARAAARRGGAPRRRRRPDRPPVTAFGETKRPAAWGRDARCQVSTATLRYRLQCGWDPEVALTQPARARQMTPAQ